MKKYLIAALSLIMVAGLVLSENTSANLTDSETSTDNQAFAWVSSYHTATLEKDFETGEQFSVDSSTSPGDLKLQSSQYYYACVGGGASNAAYRFNETTLAWESIAFIPNGSPTTYVGAGGGLSYPGSGNYIYCLKGNGTSEFYRYDIGSNAWSALTSVPVTVSAGGYLRAVTVGSSDYMYVFTGGASNAMYRYLIGGSSWEARSSPGANGAGASMGWDRNTTGGKLYATLGAVGGTPSATFKSYDIDTDAWTTLTTDPVPGAVGAGAELAYSKPAATMYFFASQGNGNTGFYRYNPAGTAGSRWTTMASMPWAVNYGGSLRWDNGSYLFAFQGGTTNAWRYNIDGNTWALTISQVKVGVTNYPVTTGGTYASDGSRYQYAFQGGSNTFLRYDSTTDVWSILANAPGTASDGSALVYVNQGTGYIYAFRGGNTTTFWRYDILANTWSTTLAAAPFGVNNGASMVWTGGNDLFAVFGNSKAFRRYNIPSDTWLKTNALGSNLPNSRSNILSGGCLAWDRNNYIYALNGGTIGFQRYSISGNAWTNMANAPSAIGTGGSLSYPYATYNAAYSLYATRGVGTVSFYSYSPSTNQWKVMSNVPSAVAAGGDICRNPNGYVYCIPGNSTINHYRYNIASNTWFESVNSAPVAMGAGARMTGHVTGYLPSGYMTSEVIDNSGFCEGGFLIYNGNAIYGFAGDMSTSFRKYNISGNSWSLLASIKFGTGWGAALCSNGGDYIYAFTGQNQSAFLRYSISANSWTELTSAPGPVYAGGSLVYVSGSPNYIYAFQGGTSSFWRYDVTLDTWSVKSSSSITGAGSALIYDGTYIYATIGGNTNAFMRYSIAGDSWASMAVTIDLIGAGGALAYSGTGTLIYCIQGYDTANFAAYDTGLNTWSELSSTPDSVFQGGSLIAGDSDHLYASRGRDTVSFWRYTVSTDLWESMADMPIFSYLRFDAIVWDRDLPAGTTITVAIRASNTLFDLTDTNIPWTDLVPVYSSVTKSAVLSGLTAYRYVQFKITLTTSNTSLTPTLFSRKIYYYRWFS
ncbi:hypothetical protein CY91_03965 [Dehalococcoides mccartyi]|uniref:hypothetical protein n=1 Tax=Dehalococcoides mccartyi TaxID=61435 RepID=UPI00071C2775|nr:hypothetical protein [Dehalococcoides mccartyi]KSV17889.1 hypothetical protein CY91_03965 [Dehalococcoides mccartyi]